MLDVARVFEGHQLVYNIKNGKNKQTKWKTKQTKEQKKKEKKNLVAIFFFVDFDSNINSVVSIFTQLQNLYKTKHFFFTSLNSSHNRILFWIWTIIVSSMFELVFTVEGFWTTIAAFIAGSLAAGWCYTLQNSFRL